MHVNTELKEYAGRRASTGPYADNLDMDVLIVGAGFAGIYCLYEMRKLGAKTVIYEAGNDAGGTWRWNCYPGAGVDFEIPEYQYSIPETWKDWTWSTNYLNYEKLRKYFDHVDEVLQVKKDCAFNSVVFGAQFATTEGKWHVETEDGRTAKAKYLIVSAGFAAKRYLPPWPGIEKFKGTVHHSSFWPDEKVEVRGKRCAVMSKNQIPHSSTVHRDNTPLTVEPSTVRRAQEPDRPRTNHKAARLNPLRSDETMATRSLYKPEAGQSDQNQRRTRKDAILG